MSGLNTNKDSQACIMALLLNALLHPKRGKRNDKPSITEGQKAMITHLQSIDDLSNQTAEEELKILVIGDDITSLMEFYIHIEDVFYKVSTFKDAIILALKISQTLNIKFPSKCEQAWQFLQGYCFNCASDRIFDPKVQNLLTQINKN